MRCRSILQKKLAVFLIATFALFTSLDAPASPAQAFSAISFVAPFSFKVQYTVLPAGTYVIRRVNQNILSIASEKNTVYVAYYRDDPPSDHPGSSVLFQCKGDEHRLYRVVFASNHMQMDIGPSR